MTEDVSSKYSRKPDRRLVQLDAESRKLNRHIHSLEKRESRSLNRKESASHLIPGNCQIRRNELGGAKGRLGSYLVSGSFQPVVQKKVSDPVRRNRIIFITIVSVIVLFTLIWILFRL